MITRIGKPTLILAVSLVVSLGLYLLDITFVLPIVCIVVGAFLLPPLGVVNSVVGRLFFSFLVFFGVFQGAVMLLFLVLPDSRFPVSAALTTAAYLVATVVLSRAPDALNDRFNGLCNRHDVPGVIVGAVFLLPFLPFLMGDQTVARVAQIGGGQAIDGINHYITTAQMMDQQRLNYSEGHYYPQGFHITLGFLQDAWSIPQVSADWREGTFVFIGQYLVFGLLLAGAIGYFLATVFATLSRRREVQHASLLLYATSVAVGATAGPFLLWPFVQQGFLNYYYVIATILLAFVILLAGSKDRLFSTSGLFLVLLFGVGMSWPLLVPPVLATLLIVLCQRSYLLQFRGLPNPHLLGLVVLLVAQFVPIAFQLLYSAGGSGINLTGSLRDFHWLSLLLSALVIGALAADRKTDRYVRERSIGLLLPLLAFVSVLALMQLFLKGEVRYYVIKSAFLLETLNFVFLASLIAVALSQVDIGALGKVCVAAVVPAVVVFSLLAVTTNPVTDVRNLFRTEAQQVKPAFFDADLATYERLGLAGEISHYNSTLLHYDAEQDKWFAHMQIAYWAGAMQYDVSEYEDAAKVCAGRIYDTLSFGTGSEAEQEWLPGGIKDCARIAAANDEEYIIVTDPGSEDVVREEFGSVAKVETHAG
ncbi:hypothetical protein [Modestobacter italicus]|uniref:hypothetical protein n=1 Tax=Modestobacter italicus (strain DSM 44449 / CECT 9708 / BC 501) TaxID=2732864 RepID=UPI001C986AEF|nr:hypothetical protein [Modestobacter italicus]